MGVLEVTTIVASRLHGEMAADSAVTVGPVSFPTKKVFRIGDCLVGTAGLTRVCNAFVEWLANGGDIPKFSEDDHGEFEALVLSHEGIFYYEADFIPQKIERKYHAIGSGAQSAITSMIHGKTPRRAVEVACDVDPQSGRPVDVMKLEGD